MPVQLPAKVFELFVQLLVLPPQLLQWLLRNVDIVVHAASLRRSMCGLVLLCWAAHGSFVVAGCGYLSHVSSRSLLAGPSITKCAKRCWLQDGFISPANILCHFRDATLSVTT